MATLTPKLLYLGADNNSNVYTVSSTTGSYTILRNINITNRSSGSETISVHILPAAASPGDTNIILSNFVINASETVSYDASLVLEASYKIHIVNANTACTFAISGVEFSP